MKNLLILLTITLLTACGGGGEDSSTSIPFARDITIKATTMELTPSSGTISGTVTSPRETDGFTAVSKTVGSNTTVHYVRNEGYEICWSDDVTSETCEEFTVSLTEPMSHSIPRVTGDVDVWVKNNIDGSAVSIGFALGGSTTIPANESDINLVLNNEKWVMIGVNNSEWIASTPTVDFGYVNSLEIQSLNIDGDGGFYHAYLNTDVATIFTINVTLITSEILSDTQSNIEINQTYVYSVTSPYEGDAQITLGEWFTLPPIEICLNCDTPVEPTEPTDPVDPTAYTWTTPTDDGTGLIVSTLSNGNDELQQITGDVTPTFIENFTEADANRKTYKETDGVITEKGYSYTHNDGWVLDVKNTTTSNTVTYGSNFTALAYKTGTGHSHDMSGGSLTILYSNAYGITADYVTVNGTRSKFGRPSNIGNGTIDSADVASWGRQYAIEWNAHYGNMKGYTLDYTAIQM